MEVQRNTKLIACSGKLKSGKDTVCNIIQAFDIAYNTRMAANFRYDIERDEYVAKLIKECIQQDTTPAGSHYIRKKFADALKDTICLWTDCTREQLEDQDFKSLILPEDWWLYKVQYIEPVTGNVKMRLLPYVGTSEEELQVYESYTLVKTTRRYLLQIVGTEAGRDIVHPNLWVLTSFAGYSPEVTWMFSDERFPNEFSAVAVRDGLSFRVARPMYLRFPDLWNKFIDYLKVTPEGKATEQNFLIWLQSVDEDMWKVLTHASETGLDDTTFKDIINNNDSLVKLISRTKDVLVKNKVISPIHTVVNFHMDSPLPDLFMITQSYITNQHLDGRSRVYTVTYPDLYQTDGEPFNVAYKLVNVEIPEEYAKTIIEALDMVSVTKNDSGEIFELPGEPVKKFREGKHFIID